MRNRFLPHLNYANVTASVALFLALGGGAAWAASALPKASVGSAQIRSKAVTGAKIANGSLIASDFKEGEIPSGPPGKTGPQGEAGSRGEKGAQGAQGPQGPQGETGARGPQGAQGEGGERGPQGNPGARGEDGERGARGDRGPEGPEGEAGEAGARGTRGPEGPQGEQGEEGREGRAGTTHVVTRYGPQVATFKGLSTSYAACKSNEVVTGGGYDFLHRPTLKTTYVLAANRPSLFIELSEEEEEELEEEELEQDQAVFPAPKEGNSATGWAVSIEASGQPLVFRAVVMCATGVRTGGQSVQEGGGKQEEGQILQQEGQQVLELLR